MVDVAKVSHLFGFEVVVAAAVALHEQIAALAADWRIDFVAGVEIYNVAAVLAAAVSLAEYSYAEAGFDCSA